MAVPKDVKRSFPSLREVAISSPNNNNIQFHGNRTSISPNSLGGVIYFSTLDNHTLDSTCKPNESILKIKPYDDRTLKGGIRELTKQITQFFVRTIDQSTFTGQFAF